MIKALFGSFEGFSSPLHKTTEKVIAADAVQLFEMPETVNVGFAVVGVTVMIEVVAVLFQR